MPAVWLREYFAFAHDCTKIVQINRGYSSDTKYMLSDPDGQARLLRLFEPEQLETKQAEFAILGKLQAYGVACSVPLALGTSETLGQGYMLLSYLDGQEATDALPLCTEEEQFRIGVDAGLELRNIHKLAAPPTMSSWYERKLPKHQRYVREYRDCGVRVPHDEQILSFIEENVHLLKGRPNLLQHDDFHPGNIVVADKRFAGVIDFGRHDWGDPVHEFLKLGIFAREVSVPYCIGQIVGYHRHAPIDESFWRLYALYLAMCTFSSVVWAQKVTPDELSGMLAKIERFVDDHHGFTVCKPRWFADR